MPGLGGRDLETCCETERWVLWVLPDRGLAMKRPEEAITMSGGAAVIRKLLDRTERGECPGGHVVGVEDDRVTVDAY